MSSLVLVVCVFICAAYYFSDVLIYTNSVCVRVCINYCFLNKLSVTSIHGQVR